MPLTAGSPYEHLPLVTLGRPPPPPPSAQGYPSLGYAVQPVEVSIGGRVVALQALHPVYLVNGQAMVAASPVALAVPEQQVAAAQPQAPAPAAQQQLQQPPAAWQLDGAAGGGSRAQLLMRPQ